MSTTAEKTLRVKPAKITRLARYGIDSFLLRVSRSTKAGALMLDGGAGNCKHLNFFPQARGIAMDRKQTRQRRYGQINVTGDLYDLPFREGVFDAVMNVEVLEHLANPQQALQEMFRVLSPGGKLYLVAPQGWEEHGAPHDYFRFTRYGLQLLFDRVGFHVVSIEPLGGYFWYLGHRVPIAYRYLFPNDRKPFWKFLDAPVRHPARFFLRTLVPYLCFYLDRWDSQKTYTLNYGCICEKR